MSAEVLDTDLIWCCRSCVEQLKPKYIRELSRFVCAENAYACDTCDIETKELSECQQLLNLFFIELEFARRESLSLYRAALQQPT